MDREKKKLFIQNYMSSMAEVFIGEVEKMPEGWSGIEIRCYIADAFESEAMFHRGTLSDRRMRNLVGLQAIKAGLRY